jgi:hypothetical protein
MNRRRYRSFLSHTHADKTIVDSIFRWLSNVSGLEIWYDAVNLPAGTQIGTALPEAIASAESLILILSQSSLKSGWVKREYNAGIAHAARLRSYRIIPIRIDDCDPPDSIDIERWITLRDGRLDIETALELFRGLYPFGDSYEIPSEFDTYVSRSWREAEIATPDYVARQLHARGVRLIGDAPDQQKWDRERIRSIIRGCGAAVAILPDRGAGTTSNYMLEEIALARMEGLPVLCVAAPKVVIPDELQHELQQIIRLEIPAGRADPSSEVAEELAGAILELRENWHEPSQPNVVFVGRSLDRSDVAVSSVLRELIERTTALRCVLGDQLRSVSAQEEIIRHIRKCRFAIMDITDDKLNTCIEAGVALGANTEVYLVSRAPRRTPPFMFRNKNVFFYDDEVELVGLVHKLIYPHRRRVINIELLD